MALGIDSNVFAIRLVSSSYFLFWLTLEANPAAPIDESPGLNALYYDCPNKLWSISSALSAGAGPPELPLASLPNIWFRIRLAGELLSWRNTCMWRSGVIILFSSSALWSVKWPGDYNSFDSIDAKFLGKDRSSTLIRPWFYEIVLSLMLNPCELIFYSSRP